MSKIKILAGDLKPQSADFQSAFGGGLMRFNEGPKFDWSGYNASVDLGRSLKSAEVMTAEKVKKLAGTAGWAFAGAIALGPLGAIGGMLLGGNKQRVTFAAELKDGRRFLAETDGKTFQKIQALVFT